MLVVLVVVVMHSAAHAAATRCVVINAVDWLHIFIAKLAAMLLDCTTSFVYF